jgi:hypothetical protein
MKHTRKLTLAGLLLVLPAAAGALDVIPSHFISGEECLKLTKPCECADVPSMSKFLNNQEAAKQTWMDLRSQTQMTGMPAGHEDVDDAFKKAFVSDKAIKTQFETCEGFDKEINSAGRVAGGSLVGGAMLDPCYCKSFCREVIESTIVHEDAHRVFNLGSISIYSTVGVACKAGLLSGPMCDGLDALAREGSEVFAYSRGNKALQESINNLLMESPTMDCTTEMPVPDESTELSTETPTELPSGLLERVQMLGRKFVQGQ